jgi:hypothetical protein
MQTLEKNLVSDDKVIISKSGKKYRLYHQELLDNMPPDLVTEMARRRLAEIAEADKKKKK